MRKKATGRTVRYSVDPYTLPPPPTQEEWEKLAASRLAVLEEMSDDADIDYSDIPDLRDVNWQPACRDVTFRLDNRIVDWLETYGDPRSIVNEVLRKEMFRVKRNAKAAEPAKTAKTIGKSRKKTAAPKTQKPRRARLVLEKV